MVHYKNTFLNDPPTTVYSGHVGMFTYTGTNSEVADRGSTSTTPRCRYPLNAH